MGHHPLLTLFVFPSAVLRLDLLVEFVRDETDDADGHAPDEKVDVEHALVACTVTAAGRGVRDTRLPTEKDRVGQRKGGKGVERNAFNDGGR
ncbi:BQ5605_C030g10840 [Microbotryum silenes-dioicae]|uniref:BQ5605_C030g10840 protein n=1 Tax=Microbotryum silenes-dioicae TaxID=796604 RepID=A0A2X0PCD9_9BASI|nr:BQ5605_C030g10840 [Microbotryum silenes-dioicae]